MPKERSQAGAEIPEKAEAPETPEAPAEEGAGGDSPEAEVERLAQALDEAREETEAARADYLRALAELENVRKRARRDVENAHKFALERFAAELLGVKDSLEMGLEAVSGDETAAIERLREGKAATLKQLATVMERFGIIEIEAAGQAFDPEFHEAISMQESGEATPDSVLAVVQKGYTLQGRLLRPARVVVARAPEEDAPGEKGEDA
jgi:molecular chaperone GrpE